MKNCVYMPNIYRSNNYRSSGEINIQIPYFQQFSKNDEYEMKLLMYVKTRKLIENILLYDMVYVDLFDLPIVISCLSSIDENSTNEIIKNHLSYINNYDISIGCAPTGRGYFSSLSSGMGKRSLISNIDELKKHLYSDFEYRSSLDSVLKNMLDNSVEFKKDYSKELVHIIAKEINDKNIKERLKITSPNATCILNKDIPCINTYCEASRGLYIATELEIQNVYLDDIIREVMHAKVDSIKGISNLIDFSKLLKMYQIPDIELMLIYSQLTLEDILLIKESKEFKTFQKWFFSRELDDSDIVNAYINSIKKRMDKPFLVKSIMLLLSNITGYLNPFIGLGISAIDTFLLDKIKYSKDIEKAFTYVTEKLLYNTNKKDKLPNIVTEEYRKFYSVI